MCAGSPHTRRSSAQHDTIIMHCADSHNAPCLSVHLFSYCRFASGLLSVSFSLKQRSSSVGEADPTDPEGGGQACGPNDESCPVQDILQGRGQSVQGAGGPGQPSTATTLAALRQGIKPAAATLQPAGTHVLHRGSTAAVGPTAVAAAGLGSAGGSHGGSQQYGRSRLGVYSSIREDEPQAAPTADTAAALAAAASTAATTAAAAADRVGDSIISGSSSPYVEQQQQQQERPAGLLRVQSITSRGR
jgi:hypothetical protein